MQLPILEKLEIKHLSLYKHPINHKIYPGINMVIGGNGLGKTTLVNTILFGLLGNDAYDILNPRTGKTESRPIVPRDYFKGRLSPGDEKHAQVCLIFKIDTTEVAVTRSLFRPSIVKIEVKNLENNVSQVEEGDSNELEDKYQKLMEQLLDVSKMEHFTFLVANLLVFGEDRRTLVWDNTMQNRVIRLLFFGREIDENFDELSNLTTQYDTEARHKSESRKDIRRSIERWLEHKVETKNQDADQSEAQREKSEYELAKLETSLDSIEGEITELENILDVEISHLKSLLAEADEIELKKVPLTQRLEEIEQRFYSQVYQSVPREYVLILENLVKQGACQICGATGDDLKMLGRKLKEEGRCIICGNHVKYTSEDVNNETEGESRAINALRDTFDKLNSDQRACIEAQTATNLEISRVQEAVAAKNRERRQIKSKIVELHSTYVSQTGSEPFEDPEKDHWLIEQNQQIAKLTSEIDDLYTKRDEVRTELDLLNEELIEVLQRVNEELTPLFSHFASKFLGTDCELVITQRTRARKPIAFMYPRFYDEDRELITEVSESQRFFLDQAFRMALITWYTEKTERPTFYIVETPEGSLDLAYERNVADMYLEFSTYGHSIVITSNLNSSNFLQGLYAHLGEDREERTLDLLRYGHLSSVQSEEINLIEFNNRLQQLNLSPIAKNNNGVEE